VKDPQQRQLPVSSSPTARCNLSCTQQGHMLCETQLLLDPMLLLCCMQAAAVFGMQAALTRC
jgi:hypothetical protein